MSPDGQVIDYIVRALREEHSVDKIVKSLKGRGLHEFQARELVLKVRSAMKWQVRKAAFWKLLGSGALLAIFGGIFVATGTLFYIILPFAAFGFLWGLIQFVFAVGYDVD